MAISFALFANLVENLIQAINILGSIFYGSILGIFLVAFFLRFVRGSAVFFAALISEVLVLGLFYSTKIGYLWYNLIGCVAVLLLATAFEKDFFAGRDTGFASVAQRSILSNGVLRSTGVSPAGGHRASCPVCMPEIRPGETPGIHPQARCLCYGTPVPRHACYSRRATV